MSSKLDYRTECLDNTESGQSPFILYVITVSKCDLLWANNVCLTVLFCKHFKNIVLR